jgi:hypothetical protein
MKTPTFSPNFVLLVYSLSSLRRTKISSTREFFQQRHYCGCVQKFAQLKYQQAQYWHSTMCHQIEYTRCTFAIVNHGCQLFIVSNLITINSMLKSAFTPSSQLNRLHQHNIPFVVKLRYISGLTMNTFN